MVLSGCCLMPHDMLPLFIFEPRYREMLRHAIHSNRMFCVGMRYAGAAGEEDSDVYPFSTAGMVRACVHHEDGTSHLMLQGVQRVRFTGWEQREPFRIARIEPVTTRISCPQELPQLREQVIERAVNLLNGSAPPDQADKLRSIADSEMLADFIASQFLNDPASRMELLGMDDLNRRLRYLGGLLAPA